MKKWTRRAFIATGVLAGGTAVVGVAIRPGNRSDKVADLIGEEGDAIFDVWLKISPDNTVTAVIPHSEMGQGVHTALAMMLADELDADWSKVRFEEAPAHKEYANHILIKGFLTGGMKIPTFLQGTVDGTFLTIGKSMGLQITGGSGSVRFTGEHGMRVAGAAAKAMLKQAAAEQWEVPASEIATENSTLIHQASGQSAPYAKFAVRAAELKMPVQPKLKSIEEFKIMGTSPPRFDTPAKVKGTAKFGIDIQLPNMKYAAINASPVFGAKVVSVDEAKVQTMPGFQKLVQLENAVAVVADSYWQAKKALAQVSIQFEETEAKGLDQAAIFTQFEQALDEAEASGKAEKDHKSGNAKEVLANAGRVVEAEYRLPYLAHATMEPMNCTAWVQPESCEIWVGSQNPLGFAVEAAKILDLKTSQVQVHNQFMGGGFGRRAETDVLKQTLLIAKEVDVPVKLIWSREEDMQHDVYREANISRFKAALNEAGQPVAWKNHFLYKHHPVEAPYIPYGIENQLIQYSDSKTHVPWGNWRSVDHSMHGFFTESFIDEVAHANKQDPYQYRRNLLADNPRFRKVLDLVAEKSDWKRPLPPNWGRGMAIHQSFGTIVAEVAEVEVDDAGGVKVHRVVVAADPGFAVHRDGFKAQIESGVVYGLTAALYGEITIEDGAVAQSNFHDYQMLRMKDMPKIETHILNSGEALGGAGEPGTPVIAPALANAIYDATGERIRQLPVKNHNLTRKAEKDGHLG